MFLFYIFMIISQAMQCDECIIEDTLSLGHLYALILDMDGLRQRKQMSLVQYQYNEYVMEVYEDHLENKINQNRDQLARLYLLEEKYYLPKRTCMENLYDLLTILENSFNITYTQYENMNSYFYSVSQFQYRQSCYEVIQQQSQQDVELLSTEELNQLELFQQYYDNYYEVEHMATKISQETKEMDFRNKLESYMEIFSDDPQKIHEINEQLFIKAKQSYIKLKSILKAETEIAINQQLISKNRIEELKDQELFLKQQIIYNQDAIQQEQHHHQLLVLQIAEQNEQIQQLLNELLVDHDESMRVTISRLINTTNSDLVRVQDDENFRRIAQNFQGGRTHEQDL